MIFFITVLRALAAVIITNSHYTGVYPSDLIANGGLLGDVIFFAVSGFCLYNIKMNFGKWYLKRLVRIYPAVIIITAAYLCLGFYEGGNTFSEWFALLIYPTNYHFVASIVVLYIPFYIVMKNKLLKDNLLRVILGVFVCYLIIYVLFYDKSYYHIDNVREPIIRILFFESMLLGAWCKQNYQKILDKNKIKNWVLFAVLFLVYFVSKLIFTKIEAASSFQILNQILLFCLLYVVFICFAGINATMEKLPATVRKILSFLAEITLEIYVVQYAIIPRLAKIFFFPLNWITITISITVAAALLHMCVKLINNQTDKLF